MKRTRVIVADDHPMMLDGIQSFLKPHFADLMTVTDGHALVAAAMEWKPDLIVLDITMPRLNGIDAAIQIRKRLPRMKFVFVTMHANPAYLEAALKAGATGYVLKSSIAGEIMQAVRTVLAGGIYVTPGISTGHLESFPRPEAAATTFHLSVRERQTLQLVAEGKAAKEIAFLMGVSVKTVGFHRENIKRKLGLKSTAELTRYALTQGLI